MPPLCRPAVTGHAAVHQRLITATAKTLDDRQACSNNAALAIDLTSSAGKRSADRPVGLRRELPSGAAVCGTTGN
jgi:hypothetical protein